MARQRLGHVCWCIQPSANITVTSVIPGKYVCPVGSFHFKSASREDHKCQHNWLALTDKAEACQQLTIACQDSAVVLQLEHIPGAPNHISIKVCPDMFGGYLTALDHQPNVELSRTRDDSGRQFWKASKTDFPSTAAWNLSVTQGRDHCDGRHSLSCGTDFKDTHVDWGNEHAWFVEKQVEGTCCVM